MKKEDWKRVVKWMGYVYLPMALLIIGIFVLIQWNEHKINSYKQELGSPSATSTRPR